MKEVLINGNYSLVSCIDPERLMSNSTPLEFFDKKINGE